MQNSLVELIQYLQTPSIIISILVGAVHLGRRIGSLEREFEQTKQSLVDLQKSNSAIQRSMARVNSCVVEIQAFLRSKHKGIALVQEVLGAYGEMHSPIALKKEFRSLIEESGFDTEFALKKTVLVEWLRAQSPTNGLDAQNMIMELVVNGELDQMVEVKDFKDFLYRKGKTSRDYYAIVSLYLFQELIPEVLPNA